jgi:hypothetical protein
LNGQSMTGSGCRPPKGHLLRVRPLELGMIAIH